LPSNKIVISVDCFIYWTTYCLKYFKLHHQWFFTYHYCKCHTTRRENNGEMEGF